MKTQLFVPLFLPGLVCLPALLCLLGSIWLADFVKVLVTSTQATPRHCLYLYKFDSVFAPFLFTAIFASLPVGFRMSPQSGCGYFPNHAGKSFTSESDIQLLLSLVVQSPIVSFMATGKLLLPRLQFFFIWLHGWLLGWFCCKSLCCGRMVALGVNLGKTCDVP